MRVREHSSRSSRQAAPLSTGSPQGSTACERDRTPAPHHIAPSPREASVDRRLRGLAAQSAPSPDRVHRRPIRSSRLETEIHRVSETTRAVEIVAQERQMLRSLRWAFSPSARNLAKRGLTNAPSVPMLRSAMPQPWKLPLHPYPSGASGAVDRPASPRRLQPGHVGDAGLDAVRTPSCSAMIDRMKEIRESAPAMPARSRSPG